MYEITEQREGSTTITASKPGHVKAYLDGMGVLVPDVMLERLRVGQSFVINFGKRCMGTLMGLKPFYVKRTE